MGFDPRNGIARTLRLNGWAVRTTRSDAMDVSRPGCDDLDGQTMEVADMGFDPRNGIARTLRLNGWAVRTTRSDAMDVSRPGCDDLDGSEHGRLAHIAPYGPSDSALSWAVAIREFCKGDALKAVDEQTAQQLERFIIDGLAETMRMAGVVTIKRAYRNRHADDPLLRYMNPVSTFDDALHPGGALNTDMFRLTGVMDDVVISNTFEIVADHFGIDMNPVSTFDDALHPGGALNTDMFRLTGVMDDVVISNTFEIVADHFGIDPAAPEDHWRLKAPIVPDEVIEGLHGSASYLNPDNGRLAVSYMGGDYGRGEIQVFDCTLDKLAADFHAHYEALMHPNLLWTQDIAENMEPITTYTSVEELNASGFFNGRDPRFSSTVTLVRIDDYYDLLDLEGAMAQNPGLEDIESVSRAASDMIDATTVEKPENGDLDW